MSGTDLDPADPRSTASALAAAGLSVAAVLLTSLVPVATQDWAYLSDGAALLTDGDPAEFYALRPDIQVGPLTLVTVALLIGVLGPSADATVPLLLAACFGPVMILASRALALPTDAVRLLLAGGVAVLPWTALAGSGHVDELLTLVLVLIATWMGRLGANSGSGWRGRGALAASGLSAGLAGAAKPWGITAAPAGCRRDPGRTLVAVGIAAVVTGVLWAPFLPGVITAMEAGYPVGYRVDPGSVWEPWRSDDGVLGSWIRVVQLLLAMTAAYVAASRGPAVSLLAAFAVRIALDPGQWPYQFAALAVVAVLLDAQRVLGAGPLLLRSYRAMGLGLWVLFSMVAAWGQGIVASVVLSAGVWWVVRSTR